MVNYQNNNKDEFKNKNNFIKYQDSRTKREYFFKGVCLASGHKISRKKPLSMVIQFIYYEEKIFIPVQQRERGYT